MKLQFVLALCLSVLCACVGCMPAKSPTAAEKTALVLVSESVAQMDQLCAKIGTEKKDVGLLTVCKDVYNATRPALVVAQFYLDNGDQALFEEQLCVIIAGLAAEVDAVKKAGATIPPLVTEAVNLSKGFCHA